LLCNRDDTQRVTHLYRALCQESERWENVLNRAPQLKSHCGIDGTGHHSMRLASSGKFAALRQVQADTSKRDCDELLAPRDASHLGPGAVFGGGLPECALGQLACFSRLPHKPIALVSLMTGLRDVDCLARGLDQVPSSRDRVLGGAACCRWPSSPSRVRP
jgi:hypothetical protein